MFDSLSDTNPIDSLSDWNLVISDANFMLELIPEQCIRWEMKIPENSNQPMNLIVYSESIWYLFG